MQYLLDLGFLAVFALTVFVSAKRGFFKTLIDLGAYVISLVAAKIFSQQLAPMVFHTSFEEPLRTQIGEAIGKVGVTDYAAQIETTLRSLPESVSGMMELIGINKEQLITKLTNSPLAGKNVVNSIMDTVATPVATAVIRTVLFVVIALVLSVVLRVVCLFLDKLIKKLPAIKQVNTGLGVVLGILRGALVVFLAALLVDLIAGFVANPDFIAAVQGSIVENAVQGFLTSISGFVAK